MKDILIQYLHPHSYVQSVTSRCNHYSCSYWPWSDSFPNMTTLREIREVHDSSSAQKCLNCGGQPNAHTSQKQKHCGLRFAQPVRLLVDDWLIKTTRAVQWWHPCESFNRHHLHLLVHSSASSTAFPCARVCKERQERDSYKLCTYWLLQTMCSQLQRRWHTDWDGDNDEPLTQTAEVSY